MVTRKFGNDVVMLVATPQGLPQDDITFYHTSTDCSGDRYLWSNGIGFVYMGSYLGGTVFFTRADPSTPALTQNIQSQEVVHLGSDPMGLGTCSPRAFIKPFMGVAIAATDSAFNALVAPFRLK